MKSQRKLMMAAVSAAVVLGLAACFGGGGDDGEETPVASGEVPDSAGSSTAAFVAYVLTLGASEETSEPLTIRDTLATPADDTSEPTPLT